MKYIRLNHNAGTLFSILLAGLVTLVFVTVELPGNSLLTDEVQNSGHTLGFFVLTLTTLSVTLQRFSGVPGIILVLVALSGIGLSIELVQHVSGRGLDLTDVARNTLGIGAGLCVYLAFHRRAKSPISARWGLLLAAATMIALGLTKATALFASSLLAPSVPQVVTFDHWGAHMWIRTTGGQTSVAHHDDVWPSNPTRSLHVVFTSRHWRVLQLLEPPTDWTGYDMLKFSVFNPRESTINMVFRIDEKDKASNLREGMTLRKTFPPGESITTINLSDVRRRVVTEFNYEKPPLTNVSSITFYAKGEQQEIPLYFDNFTLTKEAHLK